MALPWLRLSLVSALLGCGARTAPWDPAHGADATADSAPRDAGRDAPAGGFSAACGGAMATAPREAVMLRATVINGPRASSQWTVERAPASSTDASIDAPLALESRFTPDVPGRYVLRFEAESESGDTADCAIEVVAMAGPPIAVCPDDEIVADTGERLVVAGTRRYTARSIC